MSAKLNLRNVAARKRRREAEKAEAHLVLEAMRQISMSPSSPEMVFRQLREMDRRAVFHPQTWKV